MKLLSIMLLFVLGLGIATINAQDEELTLKTGEKAPNFTAKGIDGEEISLDTYKDADVVVVVFTCNSCPVAVAYEDRFVEFAKKYTDQNVAFVAINNHRGEDLEAMKKRSEEKDFTFTYAYESSGDSARAYGAKVTPHCFVLDRDRNVVYQGAFDDAQSEPSEHYVINAVEATLAGKTVEVTHKKAFGCGLKLRPQEK